VRLHLVSSNTTSRNLLKNIGEILIHEYRWDPRWWSLEATLRNGTQLGFDTTGYYPYSGNTGAAGVTGKVKDAGSYAVDPHTEQAVFSSLDLRGLAAGTIAFFDNPTVTKNYSLPGYGLFG
jgi:hypothetical protein